MSETKQLIDEYAAENAALKQQMALRDQMIIEMVYIFRDDKNQVRIPGKIRKQAEGHSLQLKQLKTSTVLTLTEDTKE